MRSVVFFIARRLALLAVTLFAVSALVFVVTRILPQNGQVVSLGEEMFWIEP